MTFLAPFMALGLAMSASPVSRISIVMFGVSNLDASVTFYRDTLGLKLTSRSEDFAFLTDGAVTIGLSVPLGKAVTPHAGATELVFGVDSVTAAHAALEERGCKFAVAPRSVSGEQWAATFADPDGHRITLLGKQ